MPGRVPHESNPILGFLPLLPSFQTRAQDKRSGSREGENGRSFRFATPNLSSPRKLGKASFVTPFASYHLLLLLLLSSSLPSIRALGYDISRGSWKENGVEKYWGKGFMICRWGRLLIILLAGRVMNEFRAKLSFCKCDTKKEWRLNGNLLCLRKCKLYIFMERVHEYSLITNSFKIADRSTPHDR